jgi:hypothetical protein
MGQRIKTLNAFLPSKILPENTMTMAVIIKVGESMGQNKKAIAAEVMIGTSQQQRRSISKSLP